MADPSRLVDVRSADADAPPGAAERVGTGTLITPTLVLTARHVVVDEHGVPGRLRVKVYGQPDFTAVEVAWLGPTHGDSGDPLDVAILRIKGASTNVRPLRLGRFTSRAPNQPVVVTGFPRVVVDEGVRDTYQIHGRVSPQAGMKLGRILVGVDIPPADRAADGVSPWSGISGAGVFHGDVLVGVVVLDQGGFDHRVLTAVRAVELLAVSEARDLLAECGPLVSAELHVLFNRSSLVSAPRSPAQLVQADKRVIPFVGRDTELADLTAWCHAEDTFATCLITGPGGRGKTRLAEHLIDMLPSGGSEWITGNLISNADATDRFDLRTLTETTSAHSVLVLVDYAESRVAQLESLLSAVRSGDDLPRIRLLLLARARGEWWRRLEDEYEDELADTVHLSLPPLHGPPDRDAAFDACVRRFAERLSDLDGDASWHQRVAIVEKPDLSHAQFGEPLSLQLAALVSLLATVEEPETARKLEDKFIAHERRYWRRSLIAQGMAFEPYHEQAVAAATLIAARNFEVADAVLSALPEAVATGPIARWLRSLYPPDIQTRYWGPLQPDRIGEHHVGRVAEDDPDMLARLFADRDVEELEEALVVIGRALPHQPHLQDQLRAIVTAQPEPMATAIRRAAGRVSNPLLLQRALLGVDRVWEDDWGAESVRSAPTSGHVSSYPERLGNIMGGAGTVGGPQIGGSGYVLDEPLLSLPSDLPTVAIRSPNELAVMDRESALEYAGELEEAGLALAAAGQFAGAETALRAALPVLRANGAESPVLARVLITLASVLGDRRESSGASSAADEAVFLIRDAHRRGVVDADTLGRALDIQAGILADLGAIERALSSTNEAVALLEASGDLHSGLARALGTRSALLLQSGRLDEARDAADRSVVLYRALLAERHETAELMRLYGRALIGLGTATAALGDLAGAVSITHEALTALMRFNDPAALADHAAGTANLAVYLSRVGDAQQAVRYGDSAVEQYRILANDNPAFEIDLVRTLVGYATQAEQGGDFEAATKVAQEAIERLQRLSASAPEQYDADLRRAGASLAHLV